MSVLCCRVPDFLVSLTCRAQPQLGGKPLALLGADERVWAVSPIARQSGVQLQMSAPQAQMRCPDVLLRPLDLPACEAEQRALLSLLAQCGMPVEAQTWGLAYMQLPFGANRADEARPFCIDMGKRIARFTGEALRPTIGCNTSKFTSHVAARYARAGHARIVAHSDEARFLNPLPIDLLPLPPPSLQQLDWLGIRTLGQFARLPVAAVWQRFGQAGKLAQRWAQGRDERPVCATQHALPAPVLLEFDPPTTLHADAFTRMLDALRPVLGALAAQLEGCRALRLELRFTDGSSRALDCTFVEPVGEGSRLRHTLAHQLQRAPWPAPLSALHVAVTHTAELSAQQLALFAVEEPRAPIGDIAAQLSARHGALCFQAEIADEQHPLAERRARLHALGERAAP